MKTKPFLLAVFYFIAVIVLAHFFIPLNYDWTQSTISDLASQGHAYKWIMQAGFVEFGLLLAAGSIYYFWQNKKRYFLWLVTGAFLHCLDLQKTISWTSGKGSCSALYIFLDWHGWYSKSGKFYMEE